MPATWLTPADPAAIALLWTSEIPAALCDRAPPAADGVRFLRLVEAGIVDEVVAVAEAGGWLLCCHGGAGIRAAVGALFARQGVEVRDGSWGEVRWRALSRAAHPAAVAWLLRHGDETPPFPLDLLYRQPVVLITGPANAGKSSLLNAWCGRERAIVSDQPGTTRDLVEATALTFGWRLRLIDSAGLRATGDALEQAGQALVGEARQRADVVLRLEPRETGVPGGDLVVAAKADRDDHRPGLLWSIHRPELLLGLQRAVLERLGLPCSA